MFLGARDALAWVTAVILFLLPWQTRFIFGYVPLAGEETSFGILSVHLIEPLIMFVGLWAVYLYRRAIVEHFRGLWRPVCLFSALIILNACLSVNPLLSWHHLFHLDAAGALFTLVALQVQYAKRFALAFAGGLVTPSFFGMFQVVAGFFPASTVLGIAERLAARPGDAVALIGGERVLRAYGSFPHPNIFGGYLSVAVLLLLGHWRAWRAGAQKILVSVLLVLLVATLFLAMSKSAVIGLLLAAAVGYTAHTIRGAAGWRAWGSGATALIGLVVIAALFLTPRLSANSLESNSVSERMTQWAVFPDLVSSYSAAQIFFGSGASMYPFIWQAFDDSKAWWLYQPIHNVPALLFSEIGLFGLLAFLWFLYVIDQKNYAALPSAPAVAALMAGACLFAIGLFDHYLWSYWSGLALAGFVLALGWQSGKTQ